MAEADCSAAFERDSLYVMPLAIVPLWTKSLQRARLVKDVRLDGIVEFFSDESAGSGRIEVEDLAIEFGWAADNEHPDLRIMRQLARLSSYDVYSLRILLRDLKHYRQQPSRPETLTGEECRAHVLQAGVHRAADPAAQLADETASRDFLLFGNA